MKDEDLSTMIYWTTGFIVFAYAIARVYLTRLYEFELKANLKTKDEIKNGVYGLLY